MTKNAGVFCCIRLTFIRLGAACDVNQRSSSSPAMRLPHARMEGVCPAGRVSEVLGRWRWRLCSVDSGVAWCVCADFGNGVWGRCTRCVCHASCRLSHASHPHPHPYLHTGIPTSTHTEREGEGERPAYTQLTICSAPAPRRCWHGIPLQPIQAPRPSHHMPMDRLGP